MMAPQINTAPMPMPGRSQPPSSNGVQGGFLAAGPALPPVTAPPTLGSRMEATQLVRPKDNKAGMIGAAIAIFAVAAGLVVFLMMPRTGRIAITVADVKGASVNRVEIFVDGKKQCETAPCIVDQVSTGSHEVKVLAQGYDTPTDRAITVEARKDTALDFSLTGTGSSTLAGTGIKVSGNQTGVKLYVDAQEIGPLPQEIHTLKPGQHAIRLAGTDRYAPLEKSVTLGDGETQDLGDQTLKVVKGKATITLGTPGAKVSIVSGNDRREFPTLPIAVDLDTSKSWALEASKPGFADYRQVVSFDDGVAEKTFNISLDPKTVAAVAAAAPPPAAAAAPRYVAAMAPKPAPKDTSSDDSAPAPAPAAAAAGGGGGEAFLNINSLPPSSVTLDGRPLGQTPKVHVSVSPGSHTVVFTNSDQGLKKEIKVTVGAGETKPAIARLRSE
jgi:serine/threonine-protein kinase